MLNKFNDSRVTLRVADGEDEPVVDMIAELDSAAPLTGRKLLALADGWPVAALSLDDGRVVANPFAPTTGAVALLRLRASQLTGAPRERPALRLVRRRLRAA
jgi:hypothetical protein